MPSLKEIIQDKLERLDSVPDAFESKVIKAQGKVFDKIILLINELETKNGRIRPLSSNIKIASKIVNSLKGILSKSDYENAVKSFIKEFDGQAKITNAYFAKEFGEFKSTKFAKSLLDAEKLAVTDSLIGAASVSTEFQKPLRDSIFKAISSNANITDLVGDLREFFLGNKDKLGKLHRYSKQIAKDAFSQSDRIYTKTNAEAIKAEFYLYQGGLVKDSRDFCTKRNSQYYHYK